MKAAKVKKKIKEKSLLVVHLIMPIKYFFSDCNLTTYLISLQQ